MNWGTPGPFFYSELMSCLLQAPMLLVVALPEHDRASRKDGRRNFPWYLKNALIGEMADVSLKASVHEWDTPTSASGRTKPWQPHHSML
jgi:hypothetical protein